MSVFLFTGAFILSVFIGLLMGIFGVGGGFLLTPAMMIVLGLPGPVSVGTSLASIFINSTFCLYRRRSTGTVNVKISVYIGTGSIAGTGAGTFFLGKLKVLAPLVINGRKIPAAQFVLMMCFLILLAYIAVFTVYAYFRKKNSTGERKRPLIYRLKIPPYSIFKVPEPEKISITVLLLLGVCAGFLTGLLGVGGGIVLIPLLIHFVGLDSKTAAGTSLLLVWVSTLLGSAGNIISGNINWLLCCALVLGGTIGTFYGTRAGLGMKSEKFELYFSYVVILAFLTVSLKISKMLFL